MRFTIHLILPVCGHCARSHGCTKMGRDSTSPSGERMTNGWDDRISVCLCGDTWALEEGPSQEVWAVGLFR